MRYVGYGLLMILGISLQTAGSPGVVLFGVKPELILLLTLLFAMNEKPVAGGVFGFVSGLLQDVMMGQFIGLHAGTFMLMAIIVSFVAQQLYREHVLVRFLVVVLGTALGQVFYLLGAASFGLARTWTLDIFSTILATSSLNGLIGLALFRPLVALNKRLVYLDELFKRRTG